MKAEVYVALERLIPAGSRVVCAVSGGADSVCLLHLLLTWGRDRQITVTAAHFNHQLRGSESDRDQAFVQDLCHQFGTECLLGSGDVRQRQRETGQSPEEAARALRYGFLRQAAGEESLIATAHTADDNLETILINLVRGTSLPGLTGIPPKAGNLVRPLLSATREDVLDYLAEHGLPHVEDSSNQADDYLRNRLRHQVTPLLRLENPNLPMAALALTYRLRQDNDLLDRLAREALAGCEEEGGLLVSRLLALDPALQGRAALYWLRRNGIDASSKHVMAVLSLAASSSPSASCSLPGRFQARRVYDRLVLTGADAVKAPFPETVLTIPGRTLVSDWAVDCFLHTGPVSQEPTALILDPDAAGGPLTLRSRRAGDRIRLSGGSRSVKKLLIDRKVPAALRERVPVLVRGDTAVALWLEGRWFGQPEPVSDSGAKLVVQICKLGPSDGL